MHFPLPLARKMGFVGPKIEEDPHKLESYFMVAPYNRRSGNSRIINDRKFSLVILIFFSLKDLSDSDLTWEFTNFDVEDWVASYFPRDYYINKRYGRLVFEMRETLESKRVWDLGSTLCFFATGSTSPCLQGRRWVFHFP